jgi:hypothetical protein
MHRFKNTDSFSLFLLLLCMVSAEKVAKIEINLIFAILLLRYFFYICY